ncbi:hypothetical protein ALC60_10126 [Trachymyrmex zeteki]|uniref:Uncharacterized protein n=1 Tax=Mycetomoellerius zeteki TaxID=64791 RepID=A0A151WSB2_9HYME|nr:hypothetical protein ALC60_10126 [Trachymyrmex zeteki]
MSPCWPNSNVGCFACGNHECISRRLNSKYRFSSQISDVFLFLDDKSSDGACDVIYCLE